MDEEIKFIKRKSNMELGGSTAGAKKIGVK